MLRFGSIGRVILLGIASLFPALGFGALTWDTQKIELSAKPDATQITAVFHFRNDGNESVTITSIQPSFGFTPSGLFWPGPSPALPKWNWAEP